MKRSVIDSIQVCRRSLLVAAASAPVILRHGQAANLTFSVAELLADPEQFNAVHARGINRKATTVGIGTGNNGAGAVRSRGGTSWALPIEGSTSIANAINAAGVIAGSIDDFAAIWIDDTATLLPGYGTDRTAAYGINGDIGIVGSADKGANQGVALYWHGDDVQELPGLGGTSSRAVGINDDGTIVGFSTVDDDGMIVRAVAWQDGEVTDLGTLGGEISQASAINSDGVIVGCSTSEDGFSAVDHAFVWRKGEMQRLARLKSARIQGRSERVKLDRSMALAINDAADICGATMSASENDPVSVATLWIDDEAINLNDAIGKINREVHLLSADGINQDRELVCTGYLIEDDSMMPRMFRLAPD